ncbi:hypothetical protein [Pedobacter sp. Leaf250]|uniref:hypothetical protein n=1 Tax=Pedobacter sp. Leaf250 TaxID=2876559 RepID=UPI001E528CEF|nr:hypothetical protein [Pedobacter sp. Leaf250]
MSVTLLNAPANHSFSNDFITAKFQCTNYLEQVGVKAVNKISLAGVFVEGTSVIIKYGSKTVTMVSAYAPDDSGHQFICGNGTALPAVDVVDSFRSNHQLSTDFDITFLGFEIIFTAKTKALGFNFMEGNTTPGLPEIPKPNYRIFFKLFLENSDHTGFDEIYQAYLDLQNGTPGIATAQLGDKIHNRITADIDINGLEIPGSTFVQCKNTARKFYFEFAESFGESVEVKRINRSTNYNVIHGGLSFQGKVSQTLSGLINPGAAPADRFLKQGPKSQYSRIDQPQFLYFYNSRAPQGNAKLIAKRVFNDGTSDTVEVLTLDLQINEKYGFNVRAANIYSGVKRLDRYEIYLVDGAGDRISEKQIYSIKDDGERYLRYFLNWSSWGSLDSRCFTGVNQGSLEITSSKASRIIQSDYKIINGDSKIYGKSGVNKFTASTGFNDPAIIALNQDFYLSNLQYRYVRNRILPIEVTSNSITNPADREFLYAQSFEYYYLFSNDQFTESDADDDFSYSGSSFIPKAAQHVLIDTGTPADPSTNIIQQKIL